MGTLVSAVPALGEGGCEGRPAKSRPGVHGEPVRGLVHEQHVRMAHLAVGRHAFGRTRLAQASRRVIAATTASTPLPTRWSGARAPTARNRLGCLPESWARRATATWSTWVSTPA